MTNSLTFLFLLCASVLSAQKTPAFLYTADHDTLIGMARFGSFSKLQNEGILFINKAGTSKVYPPSYLKEAVLIFSAIDTLRVTSIPKTLVQKYIDIQKINHTSDANILVETDLGKGPSYHYKVYTELINTQSAGHFSGGVFAPGGGSSQLLFEELLLINANWVLLPKNKQARNDLLIKLMSSCPDLQAKLVKHKINSMKKLNQILSTYNRCIKQ